MEQRIAFIRGDKHGDETDYRDSLPVNMVVVNKEILGAKGYYIQASGLTSHGTAIGSTRGATWNSRVNEHFRVQGAQLVTVDETGVVTQLGNVGGLKFNRCSMPYSFNTQAVITDGRMYLYSDADGLVRITDADLGRVIDGIWIGGFYVMTDGEFVYNTELTDETSINQNDFSTPEFSPDGVKGLLTTDDNYIIVFGRYSTQFYAPNTDVETFPFSNVGGRSMSIGLVATHAKCRSGSVYYILGGRIEQNISIHALTIGQSQEIASREVIKLLGEYTEDELQDVLIEPRTDDGVEFIIVHLPRETLQFNVSIAKEIGYQDAWTILNSSTGVWTAQYGIFDARIGQWLYGDKTTGDIGILDETVTTQYGELVDSELTTPIIHIESMSVNSIELENIPGLTLAKDATVALSLSYDGVVYSSEYWMEYGQPSDYTNRLLAYRLGYIRDWFTVKLRIKSRSRMSLAGAKIDYG